MYFHEVFRSDSNASLCLCQKDGTCRRLLTPLTHTPYTDTPVLKLLSPTYTQSHASLNETHSFFALSVWLMYCTHRHTLVVGFKDVSLWLCGGRGYDMSIAL